ncbi:condensation domain-containing protein [Amycolatopsis sp. NPDC005003]
MSDTPGGPLPAAHRHPLSCAQELWCEGAGAGAFGPGFVLADALRLSGAVDEGALRGALDDLVVRHEVLRTTVVHTGAPPHQLVHPPASVPLVVRTAAPTGDRDRAAGELLFEAESARLDVTELPLLRAVLTRFDPEDSVLALVTHHTAGDGWSMDLLKRDLAAFYAARVAGLPADLPEIRQYGEYAREQRELLRGAGLERALGYWRGKLGGFPRFFLPGDRPLTGPAPVPYTTAGFVIEPRLGAAVDALAVETRGSAFIVLLAAFGVLANGLTGTTQPAVNTLTAGRRDPRFHDTVGPFLNFFTLRTDLGACGSFRDAVRLTRKALLEAYAHEVPIQYVEEAVPELQEPLADPRQCDFIFGYSRARFGEDELAIAGGCRPIRQLEQKSSQIPGGAAWTMTAQPTGETFGKVQYNPAQFDEATVGRWVADYLLLLAEMTAHPDRDWRLAGDRAGRTERREAS